MYTMKESVAVAKEADAKKGVSSTRSDNSIHRVQNEPARQLGSLRAVIGNIRRDGGTPSVESIATQLSSMHSAQRAPALLGLQQTHGNRYVQRVVAGIQAKLVVGQPRDVYEQEADRVADAVMRMPEPQVQREVEEEEENLIQSKPLVDRITPMVQRQVEEEDEEILQTKSVEGATPEVTHDLESQINAIRGGGQPLAEYEQAFFEPRFGRDFSQVRLHTDAKAAYAARAMNARAFTMGLDVVCGAGQYAPGTSTGRRLIAHELTHVVQQGGGTSGHVPTSRVAVSFIQRDPIRCGEDFCERGVHRPRDSAGCIRQCIGCSPPDSVVNRGSRVYQSPTRFRAYQIWYCIDSTELDPTQQVPWEEITSRVNYAASRRPPWPVRVFGFASPQRQIPGYNNLYTAKKRALNMVDRLRNQIRVPSSRDWFETEEEVRRRQEVIQPFIEVTRSGIALDNTYAWIEILVPSRRDPSPPPEYFGCRGPNTVPGDTQNAECQARQVLRFTGHCTICEFPSTYVCETDICDGTETRQEPNPGNLCHNFYIAGQSEELAGRRNERFYEQGARLDLISNCCRCYRRGVDAARTQH